MAKGNEARDKRRAKRTADRARAKQERKAASTRPTHARADVLSQTPPPGPLPRIFIRFEESGYLEYLRGGPVITMPPSRYWDTVYIDPAPVTEEIRKLRSLILSRAPAAEVDAHMRAIGIRVGFPVPRGVDLNDFDVVIHGPS